MLSKEEFQLLSDNYDDLRQIFDTLSTVGDAMQYIITGNSDEMPSQYMYIMIFLDELKTLRHY